MRLQVHRLAGLLMILVLNMGAHAEYGTSHDTEVVGEELKGEPMICVVIRTYWGHGKFGSQSLKRLLRSLQDQTHQRWFAQLIVLDNRPFPDLRQIINDMNDSRLWVYADWVSYKFAPKAEDGKQWSPGYHNKLYNLTDDAIRVCPDDTEWTFATNGDNLYDKNFMAEVAKAPADVDLLSFDYYSRYQRPTAPLCERFAAGDGLPDCKENEGKWCQTDLAANVYRWRRLVKEDRRFGTVDPNGFSADGYMVQWMQLGWGWKFHRVAGLCLVEHAPSPQMCARANGIWDDTHAGSTEHSGGACLTGPAAASRAASPELETVMVNVSYAPGALGFTAGETLSLRCLRPIDRNAWSNTAFFGPFCAAPVDRSPGEDPYARRAEAQKEWEAAWSNKQKELAGGAQAEKDGKIHIPVPKTEL